MAGSLGTIWGQVRLDVGSAVAGFAATRTAAAGTNTALLSASRTMTTVGKSMMVAGGLLAAGFVVAIDKAAEFEKKLDYFGAVSDSTAAQMEKVRQAALELGRSSQYSASQIADAFVEMGKAGISAQQITDGMGQAIVNLASAADIDLAQATNIVTSQIQTYSLSAKDAVHVTDELAGAANASIVDVSDLGVSLKYVGGVAHALGITFDSTTDALSLLGKAGIKGSTAGTSLRQIMVSLAGGTEKAKKELKELGIITEDGSNKFFNANGSAKSLAEVFQILQDATKGLTQEQQLMAFRTIFNNRALAAAEILTKAGAKGFAEMNAEISKTTSAEVAAKRMDNLSGDIKKLKGNIDTLLIEAGTPFQEWLRSLVQGLTRLIQAFGNLSPETQKLIFEIITVTGVTLLFLGAVAMIGGTVLKAIAVIRSFTMVIGLLTTAMRILTTATIQSTAAAMTNPYVLLVVAIIALIAGLVVLYFKWTAFRNVVDATGRAIRDGFMAVVDWFKGLPGFFADMWAKIADWFNQGVDWVTSAWETVKQTFSDAISATWGYIKQFGNDVLDFFASLPGMISGWATTAWNAFVGFLSKLPYYVGFALGWTLGIIVRFIAESAEWLWNWGERIMTAVITWFSELPGKIAQWFTDVNTAIITWTTNAYNSTVQWCIDTYNAVVEWFKQLPGRIVEFFTDMYNGAVTWFRNFNLSAIQFAQEAYYNIINWLKRLPGEVVRFFIDLYNGAKAWLSSAIDWCWQAGSRMYHAVADWIGQLPAKCKEVVGDAIQAFKDMISSAWNAAKGFAQGLWDGFKSGLGIHSPSYIERAMWAITDVTDEESKRLGQQVRTMQSMAGTIREDNPTHAAADVSTTRMASLTEGMRRQMQLMNSAASSLFYSQQYALAGAPALNVAANKQSRTGSESTPSERPIIVNNYNPVAERGSESAAKRLRTLSDMGAF